jgi:hypothetical protein
LSWRHLLLFSPPLIVGIALGVGGQYETFSVSKFEMGLHNAVAACAFQFGFGLLAFVHLCLYSLTVHWTQFRFFYLQPWPKLRGDRRSRCLAFFYSATVTASLIFTWALMPITLEVTVGGFFIAAYALLSLPISCIALVCWIKGCMSAEDEYRLAAGDFGHGNHLTEEEAKQILALLRSNASHRAGETAGRVPSLHCAAEMRGSHALTVFDAVLQDAILRNSEELRWRDAWHCAFVHRLARIYLFLTPNDDDEIHIQLEMLSQVLRRFPQAALQTDKRGDTILHMCSGTQSTSRFQNFWVRMNLKIDKIDFDIRASRLAQMILDISPEAIRRTNNAGLAPLEYAEARTGFVAIPLTCEVLLTRDTRQMMQNTGRAKSGGQPALGGGHARNVDGA